MVWSAVQRPGLFLRRQATDVRFDITTFRGLVLLSQVAASLVKKMERLINGFNRAKPNNTNTAKAIKESTGETCSEVETLEENYNKNMNP